jgi:ATP dependent DNA ligase domain
VPFALAAKLGAPGVKNRSPRVPRRLFRFGTRLGFPLCGPYIQRHVVAYLFAAFPAHPAGWLHPPVSASSRRQADGWLELAARGQAARKEDGRVTLWSRYGTNFTDRLPKVAEAVRSLPVDNALLDGEAVAFRPDGHSDFEALLTKRGAERASFVAFDLLQVDGQDTRRHPLEVRRAELQALVAGVDSIIFSQAIEAEGAHVFAKACELGLEGIVSKRAGSRYSSGHSRNWLKSKNPAFVRE